MYYEMSSKLVLDQSGYFEHSQAVLLRGNAVRLDLVVIQLSGGAQVTVGLQTGNDLENWTTKANAVQTTTVGYNATEWTGLADKYVRLAYFVNTGKAIVAAGIDTSDQ